MVVWYGCISRCGAVLVCVCVCVCMNYEVLLIVSLIRAHTHPHIEHTHLCMLVQMLKSLCSKGALTPCMEQPQGHYCTLPAPNFHFCGPKVYSLTSLVAPRLFPVLLPYLGHRLHTVDIDNAALTMNIIFNNLTRECAYTSALLMRSAVCNLLFDFYGA